MTLRLKSLNRTFRTIHPKAKSIFPAIFFQGGWAAQQEVCGRQVIEASFAAAPQS